MNIKEAIEILNNGEWWDSLDEYYEIVNPEYKKLQEATDIAIAALRAQDKEKNEPLTLEELHKMIGSPVYIKNLEIEEFPQHYYAAIIFAWRFVDPFANEMNFKERICEITAVQPSAFARSTQYWSERDYGKTWVAYRYKPKEENQYK